MSWAQGSIWAQHSATISINAVGGQLFRSPSDICKAARHTWYQSTDGRVLHGSEYNKKGSGSCWPHLAPC